MYWKVVDHSFPPQIASDKKTITVGPSWTTMRWARCTNPKFVTTTPEMFDLEIQKQFDMWNYSAGGIKIRIEQDYAWVVIL